MRMGIYAIRDRVAEETGPIFEAKNDAVARRNYAQLLEKSSIPAGEMQLLKIGEMDHDISRIEALALPVIVSAEEGSLRENPFNDAFMVKPAGYEEERE